MTAVRAAVPNRLLVLLMATVHSATGSPFLPPVSNTLQPVEQTKHSLSNGSAQEGNVLGNQKQAEGQEFDPHHRQEPEQARDDEQIPTGILT
jgi:hypothetical protein